MDAYFVPPSRAWQDRTLVRGAYDHHNARVSDLPGTALRILAYRDVQLFTCGSGKMALGVKKVLTQMIKESRDCSDEEAAMLFEKAIQGRYATDIFE